MSLIFRLWSSYWVIVNIWWNNTWGIIYWARWLFCLGLSHSKFWWFVLGVSLLWVPISVPQVVSWTNGLESSSSGKNIVIWDIIPGKIELERRKDRKSLVCFFLFVPFFLPYPVILSYPSRTTSNMSSRYSWPWMYQEILLKCLSWAFSNCPWLYNKS